MYLPQEGFMPCILLDVLSDLILPLLLGDANLTPIL